MENYGKYAKFYSEESFWKKLKGFAGEAGIKLVYNALLLYYMLADEAIDLKSKVTIVAGLGYFILPLDLIPDFIPLMGFTDDLSVLMITLSIVRGGINDTHRLKARSTMAQWFRGINELEISEVEQEK